MVFLSLAGFATVVTISASSSGYTSTTTKTTGNMTVDGSVYRGYAVFNLASAGIPASATITNVKVTFTHTKTGTGTPSSYNINGYVGDISSLSASSLYSAAGSATRLYTNSWGNASTTRTLNSNAEADSFVARNLSHTVSLAWVLTGSARVYTITGAPSPYITVTYTCATPTSVSASASPNPVCVGNAITLTGSATGATTYSWAGPNGFTSTLRNPAAFTSSLAASGVYTFSATSSCGVSTTATTTLVVKTTPSAISGSNSVCLGSTTLLTNTAANGTWSSSSTLRASINPTTGLVYGRTAGTVNISYTTGCGTAVGIAMTVRTTPGAISGATGVCIGASTTLSNSATGGTWSSANPSIATVNATTGAVYGVAAGNTTITYDNVGCGTATQPMASNNAAAAISGSSSICTGVSATLTNATSGGVWSTSNPARVSVNPTTGVAYGVASGSATITYNTGCSSATLSMSASSSPAALSGTAAACTGAVSTLSSSPAGGTWSSSNTSIATVSTSGIVYAVAQGTANITYTRSGCFASAPFLSKVPASATITGANNVCAGLQDTLGNSSPGGTWTSSNNSIATVTSTTGILTGVGAGTVNVSYSTGCGSAVGTSLSVYTTPAAIAGTASVCNGSTVTLTDATGGGSWSTSNASVASVSNTGVVTGIGQGTATISYVIGSCVATRTQTTINSPAAIGGTTSLCLGGGTTLTNTANGGTWSTANASIASVDAAGAVTTVAAGTTTISYATGCGTAATASVSVGTSPAAITGTSDICTGNTSSLSQAVAGGSWSSSNAALATVSSLGVVTALSEGNPTISYTLVNGCGTNYATFAMNIGQTGKWLGVSSDWNDAANWPCNVVPDASVDVTIPAGTSFLPDLTGADFAVRSFTVNNGVTLPVAGDATIQVKGNLIVNGVINGDGYVVMSGSGAQVFSGNGSVANYKIQNASGVT
ncbi:MAG: hypothetical protein EBZ77_06450, partial [Chitinophagia bacterium]|nr:hypothetical protein [Chitinophagia bacterium]